MALADSPEVILPTWDPTYLPTPFSGKDGEDFNQWFRKLDIVINNYPRGAPTVLKALPSRLEGKAFSYWDQLPDETKQDLELTKKSMCKAFGQTTQIQKVRDFSYSRPRVVGESLEIYAAAVKEMINTAFVGDFDYGDQFKEKETLRRFLQGLDPSLQVKCREHGPKTLDEAVVIARRLEFAQKSVQSQGVTFSKDSVSVITSSDDDIKSLASQLSVLNTKLDSLVASNSKIDHGHQQYQRSPSQGEHYSRRDRYDSRTKFHDGYRSKDRNFHSLRSKSPSPHGRSDHRSAHSNMHSNRSPSSHSYYARSPSSQPRYRSPASYSHYRSPSPYAREHRSPSPNRRSHDSYQPRHKSPSMYMYDKPYRGQSPRNSYSLSSNRDSGNGYWSPMRAARRPNWEA